MHKGYLVSIEGGEGSGKTVLINKLRTWLETLKSNYIISREPGGLKLAEQIRQIILTPGNEMDGISETLLYAASRHIHLTEKIIPALEEDKLVILDRFVDSSLAYQGYAREVGFDKVFQINKFAIGDYFPDLTIFLDLEPSIGLQRIHKNNEREFNRLDMENFDFHRKVYDGYSRVFKEFPSRVVTVDADKTPEEVFENVKQVFIRRVPSVFLNL